MENKKIAIFHMVEYYLSEPLAHPVLLPKRNE